MGTNYDQMAYTNPRIPPSSMRLFLVALCSLVVGIFFVFSFGAEILVTTRRIQLLPLKTTALPVSCEPSSRNNGKLIHVDCPLRKTRQFYPPPEFAASLKPYSGVFFEMKVEMYQWEVKTGTVGLYFEGTWKDGLATNTPSLLRPLLRDTGNPEFFPWVPGAGRHFAKQLFAGGFRLERPHLIDFKSKRQLPLMDDLVYKPVKERPPTTVTSATTQLYNNALYTGDPMRPRIGDLRITFWASPATHVSAMGIQVWPETSMFPTITSFPDPRSSRNETMTIVKEGDFTSNGLFWSYVTEQEISSGLRLGLALANIVCFSLLIGIAVKLSARHRSRHCATVFTLAFCMAVGIMGTLYAAARVVYDVPGGILGIIGGSLMAASAFLILMKTSPPAGYQAAPLYDNNSTAMVSTFQSKVASGAVYRDLSSDPLLDPSSSRFDTERRAQSLGVSGSETPAGAKNHLYSPV